jgi:hypothetical protein
MVQEEGLEPTHLSVLDPKSSASAYSATLALFVISKELILIFYFLLSIFLKQFNKSFKEMAVPTVASA